MMDFVKWMCKYLIPHSGVGWHTLRMVLLLPSLG